MLMNSTTGWRSFQFGPECGFKHRASLQFGIFTHTVCPGSSDPAENLFDIFASENEVYTLY